MSASPRVAATTLYQDLAYVSKRTQLCYGLLGLQRAAPSTRSGEHIHAWLRRDAAVCVGLAGDRTTYPGLHSLLRVIGAQYM